MAYTLSLTDTQVFTVVRAWIIAVLGTAVDPNNVVRVPTNRTAPPKTYPYITMTPVLKEQIAWPEPVVSNPVIQPQSVDFVMPTRYQIQLDAYGGTSGDIAQTLFSVFESPGAFDFYNANAIVGVYPLWADNPHQTPFVDGEAETELRWTMDINLQINPVVTTDIQTASQVSVTIINVDAAYH